MTALWWIVACTAPIPVPQPIDTGGAPQGEPVVAMRGDVPRNLLMISIDTLRRDHLQRYAVRGAGHMPWLSAWLSEAVVFDDHQQCSSWTYASTVCTLSGRHNADNGFLPKLTNDLREPVPEGQVTLATQLRDAGFSTLLVSPNPWLSEVWNNAQGYEIAPELGGGTITALGSVGLGLLDGVLAEASPPERWFLHLHAVEPHIPYNPPTEYLKDVPEVPWDMTTQVAHYETTVQWPHLSSAERAQLEAALRARYAAELAYLDDQLATLWDRLLSAGLLEDTLVVLWSDHGEQFWEHDEQSHAWGLAAEENDAVMAVWAPDLVAPVAWTGPTHATDLVPTVLHALGLPPPAATNGYVVGTAPAGRPRFAMVSGRGGTVQAVTSAGWKLEYNWSGTVRMWHRPTDPEETRDLFVPWMPIAGELWRLLSRRVALLEPLETERTPTPPVGL